MAQTEQNELLFQFAYSAMCVNVPLFPRVFTPRLTFLDLEIVSSGNLASRPRESADTIEF